MAGIFSRTSMICNCLADFAEANVASVFFFGDVILQKPVRFKPADEAESLQKSVLHAEHKLYPEAIKVFEEKRVKVRKNKVFIS